MKDALAILDSEEVQIIISDLAMPDASGFELLETVKQRRIDGATIPAIALTAYARNEDREHVLAAGFQMHLAKPVEPEALVAAVMKLASRMRGG